MRKALASPLAMKATTPLMTAIFLTLIAISIALTSAPAFSQTTGASTSALAGTSLDTIVVTSSRIEEAFRDVTTNMTVIDERAIAMSGATNLFDLMKGMGFAVSTNLGGNGQIQMRGFTTEEHGNDLDSDILLLMDGRRILTGNLAMVGMANIERVEIIRGPASAQYGTSSLGGVINLVTRKNPSTPFSTSLEIGGGTFDAVKAAFKLGAVINSFDLSLGAGYNKRDDYSTAEGRLFENSYYKNYGVNLNLGYSFADTQRIALVLNYFEVIDAGMPGYNGITSPGENHVGRTNYLVGLDYDGATSDGTLSWLARIAYGQDNRDYWYVNDQYNTDSFYGYKSQTAQGQLTWKHSFLTLTGGLDYLNYDMDSWGGAMATDASEYTNFGLYLIAKTNLLDNRLIFSAAGRFDSFESKASDGGVAVSQRERHFAPSVGVAFLPFEWLKLRANYANAFVMPSPNELGLETRDTYGIYRGNSNLRPAVSNTFEFGFDVSNQFASASATYFSNKTKGYIGTAYGFDVLAKLPVYTYQNFDIAYRSGIELSLSADLAGMAGQNFERRPYVNFTHMFKYTGITEPGTAYQPIPGIAENVFGAGVIFSQTDAGIIANVNINKITGFDPTVNPNNTDTTVVTLSVEKRLFRLRGDAGEFYAKLLVDNFTDEEVQYSRGYPIPGRNIYLGLGYRY